jgi:hypothetical protein
VSDNAVNFKTSAKFITKIGRSTKVQEYIANVGVEWRFIVKKAPWWGGFWERQIRITKDCVKKVVGRAVLTFEELRTLLVEVEAVVNSRPLTYVYDDVDSRDNKLVHTKAQPNVTDRYYCNSQGDGNMNILPASKRTPELRGKIHRT